MPNRFLFCGHTDHASIHDYGGFSFFDLVSRTFINDLPPIPLGGSPYFLEVDVEAQRFLVSWYRGVDVGGSTDRYYQLIDFATGQELVPPLYSRRQYGENLMFSADKRTLIGVGEGRVVAADIESDVTLLYDSDYSYEEARLNGDGTRLVTVADIPQELDSLGVCVIWDTGTWEKVAEYVTPYISGFWSDRDPFIRFSPDGAFCFILGVNVVDGMNYTILDTETWSPIEKPAGLPSQLNTITWSDDMQFAAVRWEESPTNLRIHDGRTFEFISDLPGMTWADNSMTFDLSRSLFLHKDYWYNWRIYDTNTWTQVSHGITYDTHHSFVMTDQFLCTLGGYSYMGNQRYEIRLYSLDDLNAPREVYRNVEYSIDQIQLIPDNWLRRVGGRVTTQGGVPASRQVIALSRSDPVEVLTQTMSDPLTGEYELHFFMPREMTLVALGPQSEEVEVRRVSVE